MRILNRLATLTDQGLEYEADHMHADILMKDICIVESNKGVVTPGLVSTGEGGQSREKKLDSMEDKVYLERWRREATTWVRIAWTRSSRRMRRQG